MYVWTYTNHIPTSVKLKYIGLEPFPQRWSSATFPFWTAYVNAAVTSLFVRCWWSVLRSHALIPTNYLIYRWGSSWLSQPNVSIWDVVLWTFVGSVQNGLALRGCTCSATWILTPVQTVRGRVGFTALKWGRSSPVFFTATTTGAIISWSGLQQQQSSGPTGQVLPLQVWLGHRAMVLDLELSLPTRLVPAESKQLKERWLVSGSDDATIRLFAIWPHHPFSHAFTFLFRSDCHGRVDDTLFFLSGISLFLFFFYWRRRCVCLEASPQKSAQNLLLCGLFV